jgi:hypothetical protein
MWQKRRRIVSNSSIVCLLCNVSQHSSDEIILESFYQFIMKAICIDFIISEILFY